MKVNVCAAVSAGLLLATGVNAFVPGHVSSNAMISLRKTTTNNNAPDMDLSNPFYQGISTTSTARFALTESLVQASTDAMGSTTSMNPLLQYFFETLIANGVPAFFTIVVIGFAAAMFGKSRQGPDDNMLRTDNPVAALYDDLYGDQEQDKMFSFFGGGGGGGPGGARKKLPKNSGVPKDQFLTITHLNQKMDSYDYSLAVATQSKAAAAASFRKSAFSRALEKALGPLADNLPASTLQTLQKAEAKFLEEGQELISEMQKVQTRLTQIAIDDELKKMGLKTAYDLVDPNTVNTTEALETNATTTTTSSDKGSVKKSSGSKKGMGGKMMSMLQGSDVVSELQDLELEFIREVVKAVGPERGPSLRTVLLGDVAARGSGGLLLMMLEQRPLTALLSSSKEEPLSSQPPRVFMARFPGDTTASQVANLREEVTAIVRSAKPGDEALVVLQTGGGTVTGYGLAAAQLMRFKEAGMKLTIAVEQVAASGGYMMACVADRIVASPFAVLGSIGVISDIPNVYDRLKKEGVEFQTVTAGKYKRTLTPTKRVTKEDFEKTKSDVEDILRLFRDYVAQNRPQLDIESVATGETWFGTAAMERKLCDEIKTVDGVLMEYMDSGSDVYEVKYSPPLKSAFPGLVSANAAEAQEGSLVQQGIRWFVQTVATEVKAAVAESTNLKQPIQERYRMEDDSSKWFKAED